MHTSQPELTLALALAALARQRRAGQILEAEHAARELLSAHPGSGEVWSQVAQLQEAKGNRRDAEAAYRRAIELAPELVEPHLNLAVLLVRRGISGEALLHFERAAELAPKDPLVLSNLGAIYRKLGRLERALEVLERSLACGEQAAAQSNLGLTLADQGRVSEALAHLERAVALRPERLEFHDSLLLQMHYVPVSAARMAAAHERYGRIAASKVTLLRATVCDRLPERRLRVGLVSADLRSHSVAFFLEPLLLHRDPARIEYVAYSGVLDEDAVSARLREHCVAWRRTAALEDGAVADMVRADGIDVLIDLAGHTAGARLGVFARGPAPLQVSYLGYPDDTGLTAIDYRVTDGWADPPAIVGGESTNRVLRMEGGFLCYQPLPSSPPVAPAPSAGNPLTFGSFSTLNKLSDDTLDLWSRVLDGAAGARLYLKDRNLADVGTRARLSARLTEHGLTADRVLFGGPNAQLAEHLAHYSHVDIALDTFPYHGATTTCDALWMGVPVVTLAGDHHVSRVGVSLLMRAGLQSLVAHTPDEYVRIALALAADPGRRQSLRATLRQDLNREGLTDGERAARAFEAVLRQAWIRLVRSICAP